MKMKKIAAALLAMMMVVSITACGGNDERDDDRDRDDETSEVRDDRDDEDEDDEDEDEDADEDSDASAQTGEVSVSADTASTAEATTSATTSVTPVETTTTATTAPAEPEIPEVLPVMNIEPELIMNGSMVFKQDGKNYVYNITENEMYETEYDVDDITVLKGCVAVYGQASPYGIDMTDAYVVNLKTGEQYAHVKPFYDSDWNGSYLTVGTLEESFLGDTVSIGVLNDNGEWVCPLSGDYSICNIENIGQAACDSQNEQYISFYKCIYDVINDKTIMFDGDGGITMTNSGMVMRKYNYDKDEFETYHYDIATGDSTYIDNMANVFTINMSIKNGTLKLYDENYNFAAEYDISDYDVSRNDIKGATENVLVFKTMNDKRDFYTVILDASNNFVCEPIKGNSIGNPYFSENKIVFVSSNVADRIVDINTGEITEYDDSFDIVAYDDVNDLMLVNTNGAYYLVAPEAPDTLINPFERAYN